MTSPEGVRRRLTDVQRVARIGDWEACLKTGKIFWSDETFRLFERDPALGPHASIDEYLQYYGSEDVALIRRRVQEALEQKQSCQMDLLATLPSGRTMYHCSTIEPLVDAAGQVVCLRGTVQDVTDRKRTLEEHQKLLDLSLDLIGVAHVSGYFRQVNPAFTRILGYPEEQMLTTPFLDFIHPEDRARTALLLESLRHGGGPGDFENRYRCRDGSIRWIHWRFTAADSSGLVLATGRDMTQHRREYELMREVERAAKIGGWELDFNTQKVFWSRQTYLIHDLSPDGPPPTVEQALSYYGPEGRPVLQAAIERAMRDGSGWKLELPFTTATGRRIWVLAEGRVEMVDGKPVRAYGAFQDITERRLAADMLRESERRLNQIVEHLPIGAVYIQGQTLTFNKAAEQITGYRRDELTSTGEWMQRLHDGGMTSELYHHPPGVPLTLRRKDGAERLIDVTAYQLDGAEVWLLDDVTEAHRDAERNRRQSAEVNHTSQLITAGELASGLAHELNQPLGAIANFSEACIRILTRKGDTPPDVMQMLRDIAGEAVRAGQVIHHLRNLTAKREPKREPIDVCDVIRVAARLIQPDARAQKVDINLQLSQPHITVEADYVQLMQVMLNLIRNAIEAMCEGGGGKRQVTVSCHTEAEWVDVSVSDTGPGLTTSVHEKLFEPFYTTKPQGLGMGLHICRSIIDSHGGRIWCSGDAGGATFHLQLPKDRYAAVPAN
jgi:PAS domain S-box-containing protein